MLLADAVGTLFSLLVAKIQLAALRQLRSLRAKLDAKVAQAKEAPSKAVTAAKRAVYVAPFYARAAVEMAIGTRRRWPPCRRWAPKPPR